MNRLGSSVYIVGALLAAGASFAMGQSWWQTLLHAALSWAYVAYLCC